MATAAKPAEQGSIYAYETQAGTRYRFTFRRRHRPADHTAWL